MNGGDRNSIYKPNFKKQKPKSKGWLNGSKLMQHNPSSLRKNDLCYSYEIFTIFSLYFVIMWLQPNIKDK